MDLEKFSDLWAKDGSWMLLPTGTSYSILGYNELGQLDSLVIEDDDLYEAVINKMKSEGVKILTENEADELFKSQLPEGFDNPTKNRELLEQAMKNYQIIKNALRELLDNLDEVKGKHPEIKDTAVREELHLTILDYFVFGSATNDFPSEIYYAMFSDEGNEVVHKALVQFLTHPEVKAARQQLTTPEERLAAFQDGEVESSNGNYYDYYFGWSDGLPPR